MIQNGKDYYTLILRVNNPGEACHSTVNFGSERACLTNNRALKPCAFKPAPQSSRIIVRYGHDVCRLKILSLGFFNQRSNNCQKPTRRHAIVLAPRCSLNRNLIRREFEFANKKLLHTFGAAYERANSLGYEIA